MVGTVGARIDGQDEPLAHTTPEAPELQSLLATMRDQGVRTVAIEVSSHALAQHRVDGTWFAGGLLHEPHPRPSRLPRLPRRLLREPRRGCSTPPGPRAATVNLDDPRGATLAQRCRDRGLAVTTYAAARRDADVVADAVRVDEGGGRFTLGRPRTCACDLHTPLLGAVNVENALAAAVTARARGLPVRRDRGRAGLGLDGPRPTGARRRRAAVHRAGRLRGHPRRARARARRGAGARCRPRR